MTVHNLMKTILSNLLYGFLQNWMVRILARPKLIRLNEFLFVLSIRTLGVLNFQNENLTGENEFVRTQLLTNDDPNFLVVDVGANIGEFAELVLAQTHRLRIISFEPNPAPFKLLLRKYETYNSRFKALKLAISAFSGG